MNHGSWKREQFQKIISYVEKQDSVNVRLGKDAIHGVLKIGDEEYSVYLAGVKMEDICFQNLEGCYKRNEKPLIKRKFTLIEV